jgi:UPF0716 protein FxsA
MRFALLLLLGAMPLIELALLIKIGGLLGFWWTMAIILGTALAGSAILYDQGIAVMRRTHTAMARGEPPIGPMVDGVFLAVAGMLLILPGFICDVVGLLLLIPPVRRLAARALFSSVIGSANFEFEVRTSGREQSQSAPRRETGAYDDVTPRGPVIEGEFERLDERSIDPRRSRRRDDGGQGT